MLPDFPKGGNTCPQCSPGYGPETLQIQLEKSNKLRKLSARSEEKQKMVVCDR